jgi:ankyrin repeat protein
MKSLTTKTKLSLLLLVALTVLAILSYNKTYFSLWLVVTFLGWYLAAFVIMLLVLWFGKPIVYNVFVSLAILVASILCAMVIFQRDVRSYLGQLADRRHDAELQNDALGIGVFSGKDETRMAQAIVQNDIATVRKLMSDGLNINAKGKDGEGFLEFALTQRARQENYTLNPELLKELLDGGIDPNATSNPYGIGNTIETWMNFNSHDTVVLKLLLKAGAAIPAKWYQSSPEDLRLYIRHGAKINELFVSGYDLSEYRPSSNVANSNYVTGQWTPLMHVVNAGLLEQAICLVELGADLTYQDEHKINLDKIMTRQQDSYNDNPEFRKLAEQIALQKKKLAR